VPEQDHELAGDGDDRDLLSASGADALVESAHRPRRAHRYECCFGEHRAGLAGALLGDAPVPRFLAPGLPDARIETEIADELAWTLEAIDVPNRCHERRSGHQAHAGHGHYPLNLG
jgi:hypothetical protein